MMDGDLTRQTGSCGGESSKRLSTIKGRKQPYAEYSVTYSPGR